jgi:hypothetical protein
LKRAKSSQITLIAPILPAAPKSAVATASSAPSAAPDWGKKPPPRSKRCPPHKDRDKDRDRDRDRDCDKD